MNISLQSVHCSSSRPQRRYDTDIALKTDTCQFSLVYNIPICDPRIQIFCGSRPACTHLCWFPLSFNVSFLENPTEYLHKPYIARIESLPKICTADSMCLSSFVFTQLFSEVAWCQPAKPARKQNLTRNGQSRSFKVIYFGVNGKATRD